MDRFGERLRAVRESLGLSQVAVAKRAVDGLDTLSPESFSNHLSRVELGKETNPSLEFLERAARGLALTLPQLFARIEGLPTQDVSDTLPPPAPNPQGNHGSRVPVRQTSDDTNAIILRNTAALDELIEAVRMVSFELRETREQNASARNHKPAKAAGSGKAR